MATEGILEAASEANASESFTGPFRRVLRSVSAVVAGLAAADAGSAARAEWEIGIDEHVAPELHRLGAVMLQVAAETNGLDPDTVLVEDLEGLIEAHLGGTRRYGDLLEGQCFKAAAKDLAATATDALASATSDDRADRLADGLTVHFRNGVTNLVLTKAAAAPDRLTAGAAPFPVTFASAVDPTERQQMWVTMLDDKVRPAHAAAHGHRIPVTSTFLIDGQPAQYPGDPNLPTYLRIHCRCYLVRGDDIEGEDTTEVAALVAASIANRRQRLAAARKLSREAEDPAAARATADQAGQALHELEVALEGSPEALDALSGGTAAGLLAAIAEAPAPEIPLLIAALLGLIDEADEEAEADDEFTTDLLRFMSLPMRITDAEMVVRSNWRRHLEFVDGGGDFSTGVMLCVRPSLTETAELAIFGPDGVHPQDMHVTLAYFGSTDDLDNAAQAHLQAVIGDVAMRFTGPRPIVGQVTATALFGDAEKPALVALVDAPGLCNLREAAMSTARGTMTEDQHPRTDHDFLAHITLAYNPSDDDIAAAAEVIGTPLTFAAIELCFGTESSIAPLVAMTDADDQEAAMSDTLIPPVELLTEAFDVGDSVAINSTDLVGVVTEIATAGSLTDSQGNELVAGDASVYLVTLWEHGLVSTVTVAAAADELTPVDHLEAATPPPSSDDEEDPEDPDMPPDEEDMPNDMEKSERRKELEARAAAADWDYEMVITVEGAESGDRRFINEGALTWRDLDTGPLPLMLQRQNPETGGHALAVVAGSIWQILRDGTKIIGRGFFDSGTDGQEARRLIEEGTVKGVSADIDMVESDIVGDELDADIAPRLVLTKGRVMGATITPFPAFQEAIIRVLRVLAASADPWHLALEINNGTGDAGAAGQRMSIWTQYTPWEGHLFDNGIEVLLASPEGPIRRNSYPTEPPVGWFGKRSLDRRYAGEVDADGAVWGHVAGWNECHIGSPTGQCILPPRSRVGYKHGYEHWRRSGSVITSDGQKIRTCPIFLDLNHSHSAIPADAAQEMEHTGCAVADVVFYEDEWGIQMAGAVRPTASPEMVRVFRGSDVSPHWCWQDGNLELVGGICVNVSGYPPPKVLVASGREIELASGVRMIWNYDEDRPEEIFGLGMIRRNVSQIESLRSEIDDLYELLAPVRADLALKRIARARDRMVKSPTSDLAARAQAALSRLGASRS
jgi:2'-5' RNA ligase